MPILYAMFRFFPSNIDLRGQSFLWADDLGAFDSVLDLPFSIPTGARQRIYHSHGYPHARYMRMTMANQSMPQQPGMPDMKTIQNIMPFTMLFFFNGFASGLSLYYFTANVVSIGQMVTIKRFFINEDKIKANRGQQIQGQGPHQAELHGTPSRGRQGSREEAKGTGAQEERGAFEPQKKDAQNLWLGAFLVLLLGGCRETKDTAMQVQVLVGLQRTPYLCNVPSTSFRC